MHQWAQLFVSLVSIVSLSALDLHAQTHPEVIRGRVTTDSDRVIVGAQIIATMAPNRDIFRATSDSTGHYRIDIPAGTGDYLVYIAAEGRRPLRKRVMRAGSETTFVVDARLALDVAVIPAVRTTAQRSRPPRGDETPSTIGGLTTQYGTVNGALSPDQIGDLAAMAAIVPGVSVTPGGGVSVFGVDPSQNRTTVNGLTFDGSSLPRELRSTVRVASSTYDPTVGGFGGALIDVQIRPGQTLTLSEGHITLDAPQLQAADATARALGQRYSNLQFSYGRSGALRQDGWVYNAAIQGARRAALAPSVLTADASALQRLGVARDSAVHFLGLLDDLGVPVEASGAGSDRITTTVNGGFRIDRAQANGFGLLTNTKTRFTLAGLGNYSRTGAAGSEAVAPPAHDLRAASGNASLQAIVSQYFGADDAYLSETKTAVSFTDQQTNPYVVLPAGTVRVSSELADGLSGVTGLEFGGASKGSDTQTWRWEASNELSFNPFTALTHRFKLFSQAELDGYRQESQSNALGTFTYNSLADLSANLPASYSRVLYTPLRTGGEASGAFAFADYWTKSPDLQFVFGPRLEWNAFTTTPRENSEVTRLFGANTGVTPSSMHVSPRVGFNWYYRGERKSGSGVSAMSTNLGSERAPPKGVLRGGVGEFRSVVAPSLLSDAIANTGLAGSTTLQISCVGLAAPIPDWADYLTNSMSIPQRCASGSDASAFVDAAPAVQLFDPSYAPARRWTGNLSWASAYRVLSYQLDASYTLQLNQPSLVDLNFTGEPRFTLDDEDDRPVFVTPASIVPSTGLVSPLDARVSNQFGRVVSRRSDLRSDFKQATISLVPYLPRLLSQFMVNGSYTYSSSRQLASGYDDGTFGDPRALEWSSGFIATHQVRAALGYWFRKLNAAFTTYWTLQSGYPYTPIVAGDVNGDGLSNDRAFVFDPVHAPTTALATGMSNLLSSTTSEARDCLERQLRGVAGVNSCHRPWAATMNARIDWLKQFGDQWHYVRGSINFANPLGGLDLVLHGNDHLHGWGAPAAPDPTLYLVRGFDPVTQRFAYEVNPRFGNTRPSLGALLNPFRVTFELTFSINGNVQRQQLGVFMHPTRSAPGVRPPVDTILRRLRSTGVSPASPFYWVIDNADSLLLSPEQLSAVEAAQQRLQIRLDSAYRVLAGELSALPTPYDEDAVLARIQQANRAAFNNIPDQEAAVISRTLTPIQFRLLPSNFARQWNIAPPNP